MCIALVGCSKICNSIGLDARKCATALVGCSKMCNSIGPCSKICNSIGPYVRKIAIGFKYRWQRVFNVYLGASGVEKFKALTCICICIWHNVDTHAYAHARARALSPPPRLIGRAATKRRRFKALMSRAIPARRRMRTRADCLAQWQVLGALSSTRGFLERVARNQSL